MILENWDNCQLGQPSIENTTHRSTPGSSHDSGYSTTGPLPGNCYASQVTSRNFINSPVPQPTFEPLSSIQPLNQITTARESDELDFEALFENIEHVPNDGLFDAIN
jgi:hypothetical protein